MLGKLTSTERQILANQFRILDKLSKGGEDYILKAEILERGYVGKYDDVYSVSQEELRLEICKETEDILHMYRIIGNVIGSLSEEEKKELDLDKIKFDGFDANNDPHYRYAKFMIEKMGLWEEYKSIYLNSHSQMSLNKYRNMLKISSELMTGDKYDLNKSDLEELIGRI